MKKLKSSGPEFKRPLTLIAALLAVALCLTYILVNSKAYILGFINKIISLNSNVYLLIIKMLSIALAVSIIMYNLKTTTVFSSSHTYYKKKLKKIIIAIIFNLAFAGVIIYIMLDKFKAVNLVVLIGMVISSAMYIVDIWLEKLRNTKANVSAKQGGQLEQVTDQAEITAEQTKQEQNRDSNVEQNKQEQNKDISEQN